jgi:hypothetical protein
MQTKKIGAPPKRDPKPGERFQIGVRVTPELKRRLDAAAEQSGRSQSQEAELRLERSFDRTDLLTEVMTLAYGKDIATDLMRIGAEMEARRHRKEAPFALAAAFYFAHYELDEAIKTNQARGLPFWPTQEQLLAAFQRLNEFLIPDWQRAGHAAEEPEEEAEKKFKDNVVQFRKKASG